MAIMFLAGENATSEYTATLKDKSGAVIPAADITALTLTLYLQSNSATLINSRDAQNVLNTNNVTVSSSGVLVWSMQKADNEVVDQDLDKELHIGLFQYSWNSGAENDHHTVRIMVERTVNVAAL